MKIKDLVIKAYKAKVESERQKVLYDGFRQQIQKHFDKQAADTTSIEVDNIVASKRERIDINYLPEKLRQKLDKRLFKKVTNRTYFIKDIDGLVELLREAGIKPKQFKQLIDVAINVNKEELKKMYELGEITKADLDGCYTAKIIKYIDLRAGKGGTD